MGKKRAAFRCRLCAAARYAPRLTLALALSLFASLPASSQGLKFNGMVSLQSGARLNSAFEPVFNLRFIPEVKFSLASGHGVTIDAEASASAFGSAMFLRAEEAQTDGDVKPYRV